jgi:hypothetical protein
MLTNNVHACLFAIACLLVVSLLSRMTMTESALGAHGKRQILGLVRKLGIDSDAQAEMSRQDTDPLVALLHNVEAAANARVAKRLADESGLPPPRDYLASIDELSLEQDELLRALGARVAL